MAHQVNGTNLVDEEVLKEIAALLAQIQFGSLKISIHNGRVVQLERREKKRIDKGDSFR